MREEVKQTAAAVSENVPIEVEESSEDIDEVIRKIELEFNDDSISQVHIDKEALSNMLELSQVPISNKF